MFRTLAVCMLGLAACTGEAQSDGADDDPSAEAAGPTVRVPAIYVGEGVVQLANDGAIVRGPMVDELIIGHVYELRLMPTSETRDGRGVFELVNYRPETVLLGKASHTSDGIALQTILGNTWRLTGSVAPALVETTRDVLPGYEPDAMTVSIRGFAARDGERARVTSWALVPMYRCVLAKLPVVKILLSNITADHALQVDEWMTYRGEVWIGAGTCIKTDGTYACSLKSWGSVSETWSFTPPMAGSIAFDFTTSAEGSTASERAFTCEVIQVAELRAQSDD